MHSENIPRSLVVRRRRLILEPLIGTNLVIHQRIRLRPLLTVRFVEKNKKLMQLENT